MTTLQTTETPWGRLESFLQETQGDLSVSAAIAALTVFLGESDGELTSLLKVLSEKGKLVTPNKIRILVSNWGPMRGISVMCIESGMAVAHLGAHGNPTVTAKDTLILLEDGVVKHLDDME
jgi:hypothetical protein